MFTVESRVQLLKVKEVLELENQHFATIMLNIGQIRIIDFLLGVRYLHGLALLINCLVKQLYSENTGQHLDEVIKLT